MEQLITCYKIMPEYHKNHLESYLILQGIYDIIPEISDEESSLLFNICNNNMQENINPLTLSHNLTDMYYKGIITKKDIEKAQNKSIFDVPFFDKLNYYSVNYNKKSEIEIEKNFFFFIKPSETNLKGFRVFPNKQNGCRYTMLDILYYYVN